MPPPKVMIVEDNADVAAALSSVLAASGYQVVTGRSGEEALELFLQPGCSVDLVITDTWMLEGMSGLDLIARIQAMRPEQRILRISGVSGWGDEETGSKVPYLPKPFDSAMLLGRVAELLGPHAESRAEDAPH